IGKIVERLLRNADDMVLHEFGPLARAVFGMLQAALPLNDSPTVEVVCGELRKHSAEIHLTVARRAEASCAVYPWLVARINALAAGRVELRVLDVEHADTLGINVDIVEIVEALQHIVRRVIEHVCARVISHPLEEHLERCAV